MIKYLEKNNFNEEIKDGKVLVDFYADWCGPCKMLGEVLLELEDLNILKVNVDEHPEIAKEYGVMSMPALVVNEKVVAMGKVLKAADVVALLHKLGF